MTTFRPTLPILTLALGAVLCLSAAGLLSAPALAQATGGQGSTPPAPANAPAANPAPAASGPFVFGSPPSAQANRIYSVNVRTGEVSACQFERPEGSVVGVTKCFPRDASAGPGPVGTYDMVTTRYSGETGIFRVNAQSGEMSVCYVRDMPREGGGTEPAVVCTAPAR
ncbi:hypothetical protein AncyloWKF20_01755 [Ancylobacter sp. WKF20]|uniref:hypothetical protein n=1 Tax=Ancylobacter sp. WKF20 TaxID=3039801 RepID=UPI0024345FEC|nr:hypothetical protein [Ancylobacter sp. WKF20]WGD30589.1 hypothetical protein AncyloWKF20_01755 [Ancylobacter sp. WKF20]